MLITPQINQRNRRSALAVSLAVVAAAIVAGSLYSPLWVAVALGPLLYWFLRRRCRRRMAVAQRPFPPEWQAVLDRRVRFYRGLNAGDQLRFRQLVSVFLDEVQVTGVRTDVDDEIRVLVAASAIIPVFGFSDWEYHRLSEVLIYPGSFDPDYKTESPETNILGLTGLGHLRGVVILSKPSLLTGFSQTHPQENVGVHEFAHLVEQEEVETGLPPEASIEVVHQWVDYVRRELAHPSHRTRGVSDYAYTNDHEFFAVLSEYFFGAPEKLQAESPEVYDLLRKLFHQDPARILGRLPGRRRKV
jgi:Mlc titration factor MtfA (ptsG expression regulator)